MARNRFDREGQQVGDYRLLRGLGTGGFSDVYLGEHIREHTQAAVKILRTRLSHSEELKEFINEARTIRLKHPHIVSLLDFGIGSDDVPFLVVEYAPYGSLRDRLPKGSQLPLSTIVSYVTPIASALQYAHDHHLIHRDIKPENMLIGLHQEVLLSDFGIVAVAHSSHSLLIDKGVVGTLQYMAPEQMQGKPRPASDQYALGIVVYEWLCGKRPFNGTSIELLAMHQNATPPSLREQVPTLPEDVEQVVLKALAKDPKQRFARIQDFAEALEAAHLRTRSTPSTPPFPVPAVSPLPMERPNQQAGQPVAQAALPFTPPVLEPRPLVASPREETLLPITQGGTSPIVPMSQIIHPGSPREAKPRSLSWNKRLYEKGRSFLQQFALRLVQLQEENLLMEPLHIISKFSPGKTAILIVLVLLIVTGSLGIAFTTTSHSLINGSGDSDSTYPGDDNSGSECLCNRCGNQWRYVWLHCTAYRCKSL